MAILPHHHPCRLNGAQITLAICLCFCFFCFAFCAFVFAFEALVAFVHNFLTLWLSSGCSKQRLQHQQQQSLVINKEIFYGDTPLEPSGARLGGETMQTELNKRQSLSVKCVCVCVCVVDGAECAVYWQLWILTELNTCCNCFLQCRTQ